MPPRLRGRVVVELRRRVGGRRRASCRTRPPLVHGALHRSWRDFDRPRRRSGRLAAGAWAGPGTRRSPSTCTRARSTSRRCSPPSSSGCRPSTPTTATARRAGLPVGQRRLRRRRVPRRVRRPDRARCARGCRGSGRGCGSTTAAAPVRSGPTPFGTPSGLAPGGCVPPVGPVARRHYLVYTGGTTGMPKGVMWRQDDLFASSTPPHRSAIPRTAASTTCGELLVKPGPPAHARAPRSCTAPGRSPRSRCWARGGSVVTLTGRHFSSVELLDTIERERGAQPGHRRATRSPSRCWPRSTPSRTAGTSRRCGWSHRRG